MFSEQCSESVYSKRILWAYTLSVCSESVYSHIVTSTDYYDPSVKNGWITKLPAYSFFF